MTQTKLCGLAMRNSVLDYSVAHLGKTLFWGFFNTFFLFFAVYGLELNPILAGSLVLLFAATDALVDVPASFLISIHLNRFGGMRRWVIVSAPLCSLALVACFYIVDGANSFALLAASIAAGMAFRVAFTFIDIPLNASIGRFNYASRDRNTISGARSVAGTLAYSTLALLTALTIENEGRIQPDVLWKAAIFVALIAPALTIPFFSSVDKKARELEILPTPTSMRQTLSLAKKSISRNLVILGVVNCLFLLLVPQFSRALIFLVENDPVITTRYSYVMFLKAVTSAITVWAWMWLASRTEKAKSAILSLAMVSAIVIAYPLMKADPFSLLLVIVALTGVSHVNSLIWSMLPDVVDETSVVGGTQLHAPIIGMFAAIGKLMIGLSQFVGGVLLSLSGFPEEPNFPLYELLLIGVTIVGGVATATLLLFLNLSHASHEAVAKQIKPGERS